MKFSGRLAKLSIGTVVAVLFAVQAWSGTVAQAGTNTLLVPSQYPTIMAAASAAHDGDTVLVSDGVYREALGISGQHITIRSVNGPTKTVIWPPAPVPAVVWLNAPFTGGYEAVFSGFTVENGHSDTAHAGQAGGITLANGADVLLSNDIIQDNTSSNPGAGMIIYQSNPVINNSVIQDNTSNNLGGGVLIVQDSHPSISTTNIQHNTASGGGGIWADSGSQPVLLKNTFFQNSATNGGTAGALGMRTGVGGQVEGNTFDGNTSGYGGAIDLETQGGSPDIVGNTFQNNSVSGSGGVGEGGAISVYNDSVGNIANNTFSNNTASGDGGAMVVAEGANISINDNSFQGNVATNGAGGALYAANATAIVSNNCINGNTSTGGGGVAALTNSTMVLSHNTIISNVTTRTNPWWVPGGIYVEADASNFSSSGDLVANNNGPQLWDMGRSGTTVGAYATDDIYSPSGDSYLVAIGSSGVTNFATVSSIHNPPYNVSNLSGFQPSFSPSDSCTTSSAPSSNFGQPAAPSPTPEPVYRFFGATPGTHFFTASEAERDNTVAIQPVDYYGYEGIGFYAYSGSPSVPGTIPVCRFFQLGPPGSHFYTADASECAGLQSNPNSGWQYEGQVFFVYPAGTSNMLPVYRFVNLRSGSHFYTDSAAEYSYVLNNLQSTWHYEEIAFSVPNIS